MDEFIEKERLYTWVQPQQVEQYERLNPNAIQYAYESAVGLLRSQIGHIYDLDAMLAKRGNDRDSTLLFLLTVFTCWNLVGSSINASVPLTTQWEAATKKVMELKGGFSSFEDAEKKPEPNAIIDIVYNGRKQLG